ncbi:PREDICTED: flavonol synthase/flavanone 3-hydroxylase [Tarenaya hassleriana]|uniref:flavonol synthase/flavanone 3-hydroxylase n=1 Tax=Tarenaya hassleriana TaxID=28532 RepID=UPI00053C4957|nr:PREDICTED: flavonol synthase/flavanone 3-hydroxylase [Tarenaya hassleriana]
MREADEDTTAKCLADEWPEPIVRVQSLAESNLSDLPDSNLPDLPDRYVKPPSQRPSTTTTVDSDHHRHANIPIIDLAGLFSDDQALQTDKTSVLEQISEACREWGFFQVLNHGVKPELMDGTREAWREFFHLPVEMKQCFANTPKTYEGYGSRLGTEKGAILDWSDYYFLHVLPLRLKDFNKWPSLPPNIREVVDEYGKELVKLGGRLMKVLSLNLGLRQDQLQNAFGGDDVGACLRVNYYPKCPRPELALGLSSHSDPGGMTILLPDDQVAGLQVLKDDAWITVKPLPHAFIVNIGDQIQVLSNSRCKSVEHRVIVNSERERLSLAFFYNPKSDIPIRPLQDLVGPGNPPLYPPMTFDQYRLFIRTRGPRGKSQVDSLLSPP